VADSVPSERVDRVIVCGRSWPSPGDALYVVDGLITTPVAARLLIADGGVRVDTISAVKAAALYGSRGGNGVVLIERLKRSAPHDDGRY
jgi:hypothetical protein